MSRHLIQVNTCWNCRYCKFGLILKYLQLSLECGLEKSHGSVKPDSICDNYKPIINEINKPIGKIFYDSDE